MTQVPRFRFFALAGAALLSAGMFRPVFAQADPDDAQRGVARISLMEGDVSVRRGDSGDWVAGIVNAPLLTGDRVATAPNSRAEVQFDSANALRLGPDSSVHLAQLQFDRYQLQIERGTVTYRVLRPTNVNIEVSTPSVSVRPSKEGAYRISVNDAGETEVTVRAGSVEVYAPSGSQWVNEGESLRARGASTDPEFLVATALPMDDWDNWNRNRDSVELNSPSAQYVPEGVYGAEDLDQYGTWSSTPDYGYVWAPTVSVGWSPYSLGRWVWEDWYGWVWVSYDPWGWAPYHYGRWFYRGGLGWAWYPGARFSRHYWSPGLVAFFGWGGVGFGLGNIGWVPLAPYEVFHPWWGRAYYGRPGFINRNISISNVNIANMYSNARVANGVTAVRGADFQSGRFQGAMHYSGSQIVGARVVQGAMPIAPAQANLRFSDRQVGSVPRSAANTRFVSREQPASVQRIPFAQQQRAFEQARTAGAAVTAAPQRSASPAAGAVRTGSAATQQATQPAWRRYDDRPAQDQAPSALRTTPAQDNARQAQNPSANTPAQQNRSGWSRFGDPAEGSATQAAGQSAQPAQQGSAWSRFGAPAQGNNSQSRPQVTQAPAQTYRAPQYNTPPAPRSSTPTYSAPAAPRSSAPSYSAPRSSGGASHGSAGGGAHGGGHR
jgi:hypothetical protein